MLIATLVYVASLTSVACGAGDARSTVQVAIDSSGAYPIIRNAGDAEEWRAELVATVSDDSSSGVTLGSIRSVLLDRRGRLFIVDESLYQLLVFDSLGSYIARWGRRGSGPGEFRTPYSVAMLGDSVALLDPSSSRITLFDPEGRWIREWVVRHYTGPQELRLYRRGDTEFWNYTLDPWAERVWVRYAASGPVDTTRMHEPAKHPWRGVTCRVPGGISSYSAPWGAQLFTIPVDSMTQVSATSTAYRLTVIANTGDTLRVIERAATPAPVTDREWDDAMQEYRDWKARARAECLSEGFDRPTTKPIVSWIVLDDGGQIWVEALTESGPAFEVFGLDGRLRATVTGLPSAHGIDPSIMAGRIALVVPGVDDIPQVKVFRIRRP